MNHTPGPWTISGPSSGKSAMDDGGDYALTVPGQNGKTHIIAEAFSKVEHGILAPALANAQLIAAAPELLESLKEVLDCEECDCEGMGGSICITCNALKSISKAEGKESAP